MGNYLGKHSRSLRRHERRPSCTHTAAPILGPRAVTPGVAANSGRWLTCVLLRAVQRRRAKSLVLGALSHHRQYTRAFVLWCWGTRHRAVLRRLFEESSRQCSLPSLLTYYGLHPVPPPPADDRQRYLHFIGAFRSEPATKLSKYPPYRCRPATVQGGGIPIRLAISAASSSGMLRTSSPACSSHASVRPAFQRTPCPTSSPAS